MACCAEWDTLDPELQERATSLAWSSIRFMTAGMVGSCPVEIRPCLTDQVCELCFGLDWPVPTMTWSGEWINCVRRRTGDCSCCTLCEIELPGRAAALNFVTIDGYTLDNRIFRIDNQINLVRQDGKCFPRCQNMGAPAGAIGSMVISYYPGYLPTEAGLWAAGVMACEFSKACTGGKCRLPAGVTNLVRQGLSFQVMSGFFADGTGIREVDAYVASVNPNRIKVPATVWSPDLQRAKHRVTTWTAPPVVP